MKDIPFNLLLGGWNYSNPIFSPNGQLLVYTVRTEKTNSLFLYDLTTEMEHQLTTDFKVSVGLEYGGQSIGWKSDNSGLIISSEGKLHELSIDGGVPREIKNFGKAISPVVHGDLLIYVIQDGHSMSLVKQYWNNDTSEFDWPIRVKFKADFIYDPIIHPSGKFVVFHAWNNPNMSWQTSSLYKYDLENETITSIAGGDRTSVCQPKFSPNGKYLTYVNEKSGWLNLWIADVDGGNPRNLVDENIEHSGVTWTSGNSDYSWIDDERIIFSRNKGGIYELGMINIENNEIIELELSKGSFKNIRSDGRGTFTYEFANYCTPNQIIMVKIEKYLSENTFNIFKNGGMRLKNHIDLFVKPEIITWEDKNSANGKLSGLLYLPKNSSTSPPPLLLMAHGGPTGVYSDRFRLDVHYFTSKGWAVFGLNYRGSIGFGRDFREQLNGNWGIYDPEDVSSAVKHLTSNGIVDKEKCAIMGGSAGGFTVLMTLANYPGLFKAGINLFGVSDLLKIAEDTHYLEAHYTYSIVAPLPEGRQKYIEQSPSTHAYKIMDPLLILQGEKDTAVPKSQSILIRDSVGGIVEYKEYADEGHGFKKIETLEDMYPRIENFLAIHVLEI